jgi:hypothetical protein
MAESGSSISHYYGRKPRGLHARTAHNPDQERPMLNRLPHGYSALALGLIAAFPIALGLGFR